MAVGLAVAGLVEPAYAGLTGGGAAVGLAAEAFAVTVALLAPRARERGSGDDSPLPDVPPV